MSLLKLDNVGKIYVSEGNVAVGIRGVNLSFDPDEFVAITGESGSGKSTLLNVLSGMDTYEEGELFVEGQPTSHYLQPDWEQYRQKYISFIFQDYNIIDSFTVLQNVELALMTISDPKKRRERALELINRVGLTNHKKHKGSQLSGGQKQRTVIARALAKDSPIILADEPTGNLDSETAKEIIELLKEVSRGKLLIVVTHDFELLEEVATRHIRIFDGAVESDRMLRESKKAAEQAEENAKQSEEVAEHAEEIPAAAKADNTKVSAFSNGLRLGRALFTSKPKLSLFLVFLLLFGMVALFFMTALCGGFTDMFRPFYLFQKTEGRLVVVRQDSQPISDTELGDIAKKTGAKDSIHCDYLLDIFIEDCFGETTATGDYDIKHEGNCRYEYDREYGTPTYGRYPQAADEVLLKLPYYYNAKLEPFGLGHDTINLNGCIYKIVGTLFDVDTNEEPVCIFNREGFLKATALMGMVLSYKEGTLDGEKLDFQRVLLMCSSELEPDKIYCANEPFSKKLKEGGAFEFTLKGTGTFVRGYKGRFEYPSLMKDYNSERTYGNKDLTDVFTGEISRMYRIYCVKEEYLVLIVGTKVMEDMFRDAVEGVYAQASLMFDNDEDAKKASDILRNDGYMAITTDETYSPDMNTLVELILTGVMLGVLWFVIILLIIFVINLCTNRSVEAFRGDLAIMRSMGIPVRVIKIGMYVRMGLALLPALLLIPVLRYVVYHNTLLSLVLRYLSPAHYVFLIVGLIFMTWRVTRKQVRNLFRTSVKASLRGGDAA